jgi:hypothetical protein
LETEMVGLDQLTLHPENPRRSSVFELESGITRWGQYRPVVVQRSTGYIAVGNHMVQAMRNLGWAKAAVHWMDLSDDDTRRLLLWDNKSTDSSAYDEEALAELLASIDDLEGTGYTPDDVDDFLAAGGGLPILDPEDTGAAYGESAEQTQARRDYFADAAPRGSGGVREAILVLSQEGFDEYQRGINALRAGREMTGGEVGLLAVQVALRAQARCNGSDGCAWCG